MDKPQVLHGGAERQPLRWRLDAAGRPDHLAWYRVAPGDLCTAHRHTGKAETWLVVAGTGVVEIDAQSYEVAPGDAFVTRPGQAHALRNTGGDFLVFVNIVTFTGGPVTTTELGGPG